MDEEALNTESKEIESHLKGKVISKISRHRESEVCIEFEDGTRFFVNVLTPDKLEFSVTGGVNGK